MQGEEYVRSTSFDDLPMEVICNIFSYIDVYTLARSVRLVSRRFHKLLNDDLFWRMRLNRCIGRQEYPVIDALGLVNNKWQSGKNACWRDLAYVTEREASIWDVRNGHLTSYTFSEPHFATLDAVEILNKGDLCITGGRDRILALWNIAGANPGVIEWNSSIHLGWIWDIKSQGDDCFYSADWNGRIVKWNLAPSLVTMGEYIVRNPVLCMSVNEHIVVAGLQNSFLSILDPRLGMDDSVSQIKSHRAAVMDVLLTDYSIASVSEDKTLSISDVRMMRMVKSITVASASSIPVSLSKSYNLLYIADNCGKITSYRVDKDYEEFFVYNTPNDRLTSITSTIGSLLIASRDQHVTIVTPTDPPIIRGKIDFPCEISKIAYKYGKMVVARSDHSFTLYDINYTANEPEVPRIAAP